ncbi:MAG: hypothetical protein NTV32_08480, partial [Gammaproteobacteria bacterium]|nr:hypothetical protein [Gammaproteobacteria bacterium]
MMKKSVGIIVAAVLIAVNAISFAATVSADSCAIQQKQTLQNFATADLKQRDSSGYITAIA